MPETRGALSWQNWKECCLKMYKCQKRQRAYMRRWRKNNPGYMSAYYRRVIKPLGVDQRSLPAVEARSKA